MPCPITTRSAIEKTKRKKQQPTKGSKNKSFTPKTKYLNLKLVVTT